jgi:predicted AAA+ superfamily ATPase
MNLQVGGDEELKRLCYLPEQNSFFLFGARGTGKTTLLRQSSFLSTALWIDLLDSETEESYALRPGLLQEQAEALPEGSWIVIDEVQKLPKLLDQVHLILGRRRIYFALTGSSSRKIKRGGADLLAGRSWTFHLFPFTTRELGSTFDLDQALAWGTLPQLNQLVTPTDRARYLRSYTHTYLKEEILVEQLVRNLDPFRLFLPLAAQMDTQMVNYSNIARDTGVDYKTIQNYYQILVETNLGIFLEPFGRSVRKVQYQSPKFYFFDTGVKRALQRRLTVPLQDRTSEYGEAFESWFLTECHRLNHYLELDYAFSYLRTKDDVEVDLVIDRPGQALVLVEIKSAAVVDERHIRNLVRFQDDFPDAELICAARVPQAQKMGRVLVLPWQEALDRLFPF